MVKDIKSNLLKQVESGLHLDHSKTFGLTLELLNELIPALETWDFEKVHDLIAPLHAADIGELVAQLPVHERSKVIEVLKDKLDPEIIKGLHECVREEILNQIDVHALSHAAQNQPPSIVAHLIKDLKSHHKIEVLSTLNEKVREEVEDILNLPKSTAGWLMHKDYVNIPLSWTIKQALDFIVKSNFQSIYTVFLHDAQHQVVATIPLAVLLREDPHLCLSDIKNYPVMKVGVDTPQEQVAQIFRRYSLSAVAVTSDDGKIIGAITVEDMLHIIHMVAEEDALKLNGLNFFDFYTPTITTAFSRLRWLVATLINSILASSVISQFQPVIQQIVSLAVLMPIVASMGGNAGMQVVTITVRAIATNGFKMRNLSKIIFKEAAVALINGVMMAVALGLLSLLWFKDPKLSAVLAVALILNMLWASFAGILLPIAINKLGKDPALSAGPVLTTTTDVLGFSIFLLFAKLVLLK